LGQPFDYGGLAYAGLTDEHGVVLGATGEDLHDPLDLAGTTDDRVQRTFTSRLGQVASKLIENGGSRRTRLASTGAGGLRLLLLGATGAGKKLDNGLTHLLEFGPELLQDLGGDTLPFPDETEQDVLGPDVVVAKLESLTQRQLQNLLGPWSKGDVTRWRLLALTDDLDDLVADGGKVDIKTLQRLGGDSLTLVEKTQQDVLGPDVVVI
jgi:hypothetical protein